MVKPCEKCGGYGKVPTGFDVTVRRESVGLSQLELAEKLHLSQSTISMVETNKRQAMPVLIRWYWNEE